MLKGFSDSLWSHEWKSTSYWLDNCQSALTNSEDFLERADVVIIGSGYTGLNAAIEIARGGRQVVVLDAGSPGHGCSTRNGGQVSTSIKPSFQRLARKFGADKARAIRAEGESALDWIEKLIVKEKIECSFVRCGRFHAAHTSRHFEKLEREAEELYIKEKIESFPVSRKEQHKELGTDLYYGGVIFPRHASLDPAKYHLGLLKVASKAGAKILGKCEVTKISKNLKGFSLITSRGAVKCNDLVIATNGYTGKLVPWLQRRVIPIGSYIIATEPISNSLMEQLFPTNRIVSDTCKVVYYYRPSPDRKRILFGGRVSAGEADPQVSGPRLHNDMCRIFPQLKTVKISHSWCGTVAYTFDELAHTGLYEGIYYSMGYCGSGVSMASYLGMRLGQKVLGKAEGLTALDNLPFPTNPMYTGRPWFVPPLVYWYRWKDKQQYRFASKKGFF